MAKRRVRTVVGSILAVVVLYWYAYLFSATETLPVQSAQPISRIENIRFARNDVANGVLSAVFSPVHTFTKWRLTGEQAQSVPPGRQVRGVVERGLPDTQLITPWGVAAVAMASFAAIVLLHPLATQRPLRMALLFGPLALLASRTFLNMLEDAEVLSKPMADTLGGIAFAVTVLWLIWMVHFHERKLAQAAEEVRCRGCGYLLRGLSESRCPECGRPFAREQVIQ